MQTTKSPIRFPARFVCWDGEGISDSPNSRQRYVLFGNSEGDYVQAHDLKTSQCLRLICDAKKKHPSRTFVIFAGDYDVNMICRDLPPDRVRMLWDTGKTFSYPYVIEYMPRKMFKVRDVHRRISVTIYDVFTFFGCSFVKALEQYDAATKGEIDEIRNGKEQRGSFTDSQISSLVFPYWKLELQTMVGLVGRLQDSLRKAGIFLTSWHGPGAVASFILKREGIKNHKGEMDDHRFRYAVTNAYAGGRFEQYRIGKVDGPIYQYDIRSAYPEIIRTLPSLCNAEWKLYKLPQSGKYRIRPYSLYRVNRWNCGTGNECMPQPFHYRYRNGNIVYPPYFRRGWHYGFEVTAAQNFVAQYGGKVELDAVWQLEYDSLLQPFEFVGELYDNRAAWKAAGNPAQYAAKIGLNSLYGKMAQQVGSRDGRPPTWHQLEWAGMVTAATRAKIFETMCQSPKAIIATETDSIFSTVELDVKVGTDLGEWEHNVYDEIIYLQSGIYLTKNATSVTSKYRGLASNQLDWETICLYLDRVLRVPYSEHFLPFQVTRFIGFGTGLRSGGWCSWQTMWKNVAPLSYQAKRIHYEDACLECRKGSSTMLTAHHLAPNTMMVDGPSTCHKLEWWQGGSRDPTDGDSSPDQV